MTGEPEEVSFHEGPDPRNWDGDLALSQAAEDVRAADEMLKLLHGDRPRPPMSRAYTEALTFLERVAVQAREALAERLLEAYQVELPEEPAELPTEAVGGFSGDGGGEGNRDNLRPVRE